ncbi:OmpA family protein [Vibrio maritimus]|uniref:OmpA family protein n=1 Tax=Vibrio maritimus TaxID=990268 RepID=UPI001F3F0FC4|nr:OmpA family protein [Vibrio maritimus]
MKIQITTIAMLIGLISPGTYAQSYYCTNSEIEIKREVRLEHGVLLEQHRNGSLQRELKLKDEQLANVLSEEVMLPPRRGCHSYISSDIENQTSLARVQFGFDQSSLTPMARDSLHTLARSIGENGTQILVEGHTDSMGSAGYNQELGLKRALSVYDLLRYQGVDKQNITVRTLGETQPLEPNNSSKNRAINRRAEIMVVTGN